MYLATWKNIPLSKLYKFRSVRRNPHTRVVSENFDSRYGGQNSLVSSDMKRVQDFSEPRFSMIS
jgi:hypothetical protein